MGYPKCVCLALNADLLIYSLMLKFEMHFYINTIKLNMFLEVWKGLKSNVYVPIGFCVQHSPFSF